MSNPYPGPRSVIVMDNARIHHAEEIKMLVRNYGMGIFSYMYCLANMSAGCRIEYLAPYSPDFNPIEQAFSVLKAHLRRQGISFFQSEALYYEMYRACDVITPEMTFGFFAHSGYAV